MTALPSWMYGDPADVVERIEQGEINFAARERRRRFGLVSDNTVRLVKRQHIQELIAAVKRGAGGSGQC